MRGRTAAPFNDAEDKVPVEAKHLGGRDLVGEKDDGSASRKAGGAKPSSLPITARETSARSASRARR